MNKVGVSRCPTCSVICAFTVTALWLRSISFLSSSQWCMLGNGRVQVSLLTGLLLQSETSDQIICARQHNTRSGRIVGLWSRLLSFKLWVDQDNHNGACCLLHFHTNSANGRREYSHLGSSHALGPMKKMPNLPFDAVSQTRETSCWFENFLRRHQSFPAVWVGWSELKTRRQPIY